MPWRTSSRAWPTCPRSLRSAPFLSYNNAGFSLAGRIIEAVTAKTYEATVQELLFAPAGSNHSLLPAE